MARVGRKPKYKEWLTPDGLQKIREWAEEGLYEQQIAKDKVGIAPQTWCEWKNRFPELDEAVKEGQRKADKEVVNAVFRAAVGFTVSDEKVEVQEGPTGRTVKKSSVKRTFAPNMTAAIFWLKNRDPEGWKDFRGLIEVEKSEREDGNSNRPGITINYDYHTPSHDFGSDTGGSTSDVEV